ncbi:hypothetical protein FSP39_013747 [Pinctada imbricata]|uniref:Uncharacterized protein n=1 Tax=Pinctada imbricata TaxID=66713 RepID=A0AA89C1F3_PINIB|nr:hypothetical protein FSP39_013747 [Pinctada imbricata]
MSDEQLHAEIKQAIARHINCLSDDNRNKRKLALQGLHKEILERKPEVDPDTLQAVLADIIKSVLNTVSDPVEKCRELSINLIQDFSKRIPNPSGNLSYVIPVIATRLGQQEIIEPSEELRLQLVELLFHLVEWDVIQNGNGKPVETVVPHLAQRLFDDSPAVRKAVIKIVGHWLLDLPDRYSYHHKLMPLLMTGLSDEQPEIAELADSLWYDVGLKYEKENEEELKDKLDFAKPAPAHYPPKVERPNLGCRTLMFRNMSKILPALLRDLTDWVLATRKKSAGLLYWLLLNAEDYITQHMTPLLTGMYKACNDEDQQVVKDVQKSAVLVGYFVLPEVWCKLMLGHVSSMQTFPPLMVLASVIQGTEREVIKSYLPSIMETITSHSVCHAHEIQVHTELLRCVESIIDISQEDIGDISQDIFNLLITILALRQDQKTEDKAYQLLDRQCKMLDMCGRQEMFTKHSLPLINTYVDTYNTWTVHSVERLVFDTLLIEAGSVVGDLLDYIVPILVTNLSTDKDPEMRLKFFSLLSRLVMNSTTTLDSRQRFGDFAVIVVRDIIIPNCVWSAGRVAGAIRTTAVSCMWALLQSGVLTKEKLAPVVEDLLTQMLSSLEDDNKNTRLICCRVMTRIFDTMGSDLGQDRLHNIYPDLLKRLDDSSNEVRIIVCKTFLAYLDSFEDKYDTVLYRAHLEGMYKGLLIHLDDPDNKIQEAVLEVLKKIGSLHPGMLLQEVESVKHKHRTQTYCNQLINYAKDLVSAS